MAKPESTPGSTTGRILELPDGRRVALELKTSPLARRMTLRVDALHDRVVVVYPQGVHPRHAVAFAQEKRAWVVGRMAALPPRIAFDAGAVVPILGQPHTICPAPTARRGVWCEEATLWVSGQPEHLSRRVRDYLRKRAEDEITPRAHRLAGQVGRRLGRITVRDVRSRWGSCSARGDLSFSWRLVMAPEPVLSYVVVHEVAHMVELNHSPRFWAVVADLAGDTSAAQHWLKTHGTGLHRYG